jgi:hypothetical protein
MRRPAGGWPSLLSSEGAGAACWLAAAQNCWLPASAVRMAVGVMRLAPALPLAADSAGRLLLAVEGGAGDAPMGATLM